MDAAVVSALVALLCICPEPARIANPDGPRHRFLLDVVGDGIDVGGEVGGSRWTKPGTDDAFLAIDATGLRSVGFEILDRNGIREEGVLVVRDGLRVRSVPSRSVTLADGWQLLALLDGSRDGVVDSTDVAWPHLRVFVDADADGRIGDAELRVLSEVEIRRIRTSPRSRTSRRDTNGNVLVDGSFVRTDGTTHAAADITLARIEAPAVVPSGSAPRPRPAPPGK